MSMPSTSMIANTMARVSGIASATTRPGRTPRLRKLMPRMIATACHSDSMNSPMAISTVAGWLATRCGSMPIGRSAWMRASAASMLSPSASTSPPSRMAMASPIAGSPSTRNIGCGGSAKPRRTLRDVAHADHPPAGDEVDVQDVLLGPEGARDPQRDALVPGLDDAGGADIVLGADRGQERLAVDAQARQLLHRELDEDHLVLGAQDVDLGHVGHVQELGANLLDVVAQLAVGEAVGGEAVDDAEHVAEAVVEERPDRAARAACARRR